jgi:exopolysaccharide biosynthesis operon protein EpsL
MVSEVRISIGPSLKPTRIAIVCISAIFLEVSGVQLAFAQTTDSLRPFVKYSVLYDDNVLGLPSEVSAINAVGLDSKADMSHTWEAGVLLDKKFGRQYFTGSLKAGQTRYDTYKALNFDGRDLMANWNWYLGNHLQGNIGATYARGLTPFTDIHQLVRNVRTQQREYFDAAWRLHPSWRLKTAASKYRLDYELPVQQPLNRTENRYDLGLDYLARSGSSIGLVFSNVKGSYPNRLQIESAALSNSYQQDEIKANIDWRVSGKTRLQLLAGPVSRSQDDPRVRDFNGLNARLTADWLATGKFTMTGALWRETGIVSDLSAVYSLNKGISVAPRWQVSEKILLEAQLKYEKRDFTQSLVVPSNFFNARQDALRTASITLSYRPLRNTVIQTTIFHSSKASNLSFDNYRRNGVAISVQQQL